jgi:hypothetical protein
MNAFKSYASRNLNLLGGDEPAPRRWGRHGSTRWLRNDNSVKQAIEYVLSGQGEPMEVHVHDLPWCTAALQSRVSG